MRLLSFPTPENLPLMCECFDIKHSYICMIVSCVQLAASMAWELWQTNYPWDAIAWVKFIIWLVSLLVINGIFLPLNSLEHTLLTTEVQSSSRM